MHVVGMQFDIGSFLIGFAVLPTLALLIWLATILISLVVLRTIAPDGCLICDHRGKWKVGERSNAAFHLGNLRHDLLWRRRRWHRAAWRAHRWNAATWVGGSEQHAVECNQPGCETLDMRGPFSDIRAAVSVGEHHERARHNGWQTTSVESTPAKERVSP